MRIVEFSKRVFGAAALCALALGAKPARAQECAGLVKAAEEKFGELHGGEKFLLEQVEKGGPADFAGVPFDEGVDALKKIDMDEAESWPEERELRGEVVTWLLTSPKARPCITHRGVEVVGARVEGELDVSYAKMPFPVNFLACVFDRAIRTRYAEMAQLAMHKSVAPGLAADGIKVAGSVFLQDGFKATGEVRLLGADIGGNLECDGATFENAGGDALTADGIKVAGSVFLQDGFRAAGAVRLPGAEIGGVLNGEGATFENPRVEMVAADGKANEIGGHALNADGIKVAGGVFLRKVKRIAGRVDFVNAKVAVGFQWRHHQKPEGARELSAEAVLDLRGAHLGTLWFGNDDLPAKGSLYLHGFVFDSLAPDTPTDAAWWIDLIERQTDGYWPQPYEQAAKVLREMGHEENAKTLLIEREWRRREVDGGIVNGIWFYALGPLVGYGYRPFRTLRVGIPCFLLLWAFARRSYRAGLIVPSQSWARSDKARWGLLAPEDRARVLHHLYPRFNAFAFAADLLIPIVNLRQADHWQADPSTPQGRRRRWIVWGATLLGWAMATMVVAAFTGILKK